MGVVACVEWVRSRFGSEAVPIWALIGARSRSVTRVTGHHTIRVTPCDIRFPAFNNHGGTSTTIYPFMHIMLIL